LSGTAKILYVPTLVGVDLEALRAARGAGVAMDELVIGGERSEFCACRDGEGAATVGVEAGEDQPEVVRVR
jgi:hypothetical protein